LSAKYQVYGDVAGKYRFRLLAANSRIVAVSQAYQQLAGCLNGVKSVQNNCNAEIEDLTAEGNRIPNPKYQVFFDVACGYRFHLNARNGEIIATSEGYESKDGCMNGIKAVKASCSSEIEDLTINQKIGSAEPMMKEAVVTPGVTVMETPTPIVMETPTPIVMETPTPIVMETPTPIGMDQTKLEFYKLPDTVAKGEVVYFKGKLSKGGVGIPKVNIRIFEHDMSFMLDAAWAGGYTNEDGSFNVAAKVEPPHFWNDTAKLYAQADGDNIKRLRSDIQKITIK